ncbi:hypothetical protein AB1N83_005383 [Pleurotus pulmonarius]
MLLRLRSLVRRVATRPLQYVTVLISPCPRLPLKLLHLPSHSPIPHSHIFHHAHTDSSFPTPAHPRLRFLANATDAIHT